MRKSLTTDFVHCLFWPTELADRKPLCWAPNYWYGTRPDQERPPVALHRPRARQPNRLRFYRRAHRFQPFSISLPF